VRRYEIVIVAVTLLAVVTVPMLLRDMMRAGWSPFQPPMPPRVLTEPQKRMVQKFGPSMGYELKVDAVRGEEFEGVNFYEVGVDWPFYGSGGQSLKNETRMGKSGPIPEQVRIIWRDSAEHGRETIAGSTYNGKIIGEEIIEVGSRIPQALLDDLKRDPEGGLRLKFRMSNQGTQFGWDIERRPGYKPGTNLWYPPAYTSIGGDFKEARPAYYIETARGLERLPDEDYWQGKALPPRLAAMGYKLLGSLNNKLWESGWYVDKKTGKKVETDF